MKADDDLPFVRGRDYKGFDVLADSEKAPKAIEHLINQIRENTAIAQEILLRLYPSILDKGNLIDKKCLREIDKKGLTEAEIFFVKELLDMCHGTYLNIRSLPDEYYRFVLHRRLFIEWRVWSDACNERSESTQPNWAGKEL